MKQLKIELSTQFSCSLERAFKAPILGDATRFMNGYRLQPPVVAFFDDASWGAVNGHRFPSTDGNLILRAGILFKDQILQRIENEYWEWAIFDFQPAVLFFIDRAVGAWKVQEIQDGKIQVSYSYTFYPTTRLHYWLTVAFGVIQWKGMMKKALRGIQAQAESGEPFRYELSRGQA